ncbi:family A1 protease [Trametes coccinea BRFM310]|uniref:Family A1 protease n=1 Tax=Trametes coccinea (strain BRFM310) TaxID=1353009 RepID=A0A1Y2IDM8_TRAC3|nr:family A1 protease [Trametes coccinea BRFM310]
MFTGLRFVSAAFVALYYSLASVPANALYIRRDASPVTLPFARRFNTTGAAKLLQIDQARAKAFKNRNARATPDVRAPFNVPAANQAVDYVTNVTIAGRQFTLLIDTGSSNTWVGARPLENPFLPGLTSLTGNLMDVTYGSGFFTGLEFSDSITVSNGLTIANQPMGFALVSEGFTDVDGIIGIGPADLTCGTLVLGSQCIPTVTDNAFSQGLIPEHLIGISFEPTTSLNNANGELTFGGTDSSKFTGRLEFVPITSTSPASEFVGIDQSITFGSPNGQTVLPLTAGVTDTGTTLLLIASDAFATYQNLTGGVLDPATGLLKITPAQFANLKSLFFHVGSNTFEFTPNAQIWPRALNTVIGGTDDAIYLVINDIGTPSGEGLDFIDGMTFLERFYYVFDIANSRVGLANTPFTHATTN